MKINNHKRGFTIVETLIYGVGLVLLMGVMVGLLYYMYNWYKFATISSKVDQMGLTLVDRMVRDIRSGEDIDLGQSSFNVNNGILSINARENGTSVTKKFSLDGNRLTYEYAGGSQEYLSPENMSVDKILLNHINTPISQAIRISMDISYATRTGTATHSFYGLGILRQSYE